MIQYKFNILQPVHSETMKAVPSCISGNQALFIMTTIRLLETDLYDAITIPRFTH